MATSCGLVRAARAADPFQSKEEVSTHVTVVDCPGLPAVRRAGRWFRGDADASWPEWRSARGTQRTDVVPRHRQKGVAGGGEHRVEGRAARPQYGPAEEAARPAV